jgi:hypothetical protein
MPEEELTNFLIRLSIDEALLERFSAAKSDDAKKEVLDAEGLSKEAVAAILADDETQIKRLTGIDKINQNNQNTNINQNNQNNTNINQNNQNNS